MLSVIIQPTISLLKFTYSSVSVDQKKEKQEKKISIRLHLIFVTCTLRYCLRCCSNSCTETLIRLLRLRLQSQLKK